MWSRWFPRIRLSVNNRKSRIVDFEATMLIDDLNIGWCVDVEGVATDNAQVVEVDDAGDQRQLVRGHATTGLEKAPSTRTNKPVSLPRPMLHLHSPHCIHNSLSAVLVRPAPPLLGDIVLLVKGRIVAREALIRRLALRVTWSNCGEVNVTNPIQELVDEFIALLAVASRSNQFLHRGPQFRGVGIERAL